MIQFINQAPALALSGNPITFQIQSTVAKVSCSLYLEEALGAGSYQHIHTEIRPVDGNGQIAFEMSAVLDAELSLQSYDFAALTKQEGRSACRRYFLALKEGVYDEVPVESSDLQSSINYAMKGKQHFMQVVPNQLPFVGYQLLTLRPSSRSFMPGQKDWLWLMPAAAGEPITITYTVITEDGEVRTGNPISFGMTEKYLPIGIPLHQVFDLEYALNSSLQSIRLQVLGHRVELIKAYEDLPYTREFHFENVLGGFDSLISYGKAQLSENLSAHIVRNYGTAREYSRYQVVAKQSYRVHIGYRSKEEREAAKGLLHAELAFERVQDQFWPILITNTRIQDEKDGDYRHNLIIDYQYAFDSTPLWP